MEPRLPSHSRSFENRPPPTREAVEAALRPFFPSRPEVRLAYLFGSVASGGAGPLSDVDVAVLVDGQVFADRSGFGYEAGLVADVMNALRFPKVEAAVLNGAPAHVRFNVVRDGEPLFAREPSEAVRFRVDALRDHFDFEPMRRVQNRYLRAPSGADADRDAVERRLRDLRRIIEVLESHAGVTATELELGSTRALAIEHGLQLAIQCVLDVANHLVSAKGTETPDSYESVLVSLGRAGVIPAEFAERIRGMAGMRNILVHSYLEVDFAELTDTLNRLDEFEDFARYALQAIDRSAGD